MNDQVATKLPLTEAKQAYFIDVLGQIANEIDADKPMSAYILREAAKAFATATVQAFREQQMMVHGNGDALRMHPVGQACRDCTGFEVTDVMLDKAWSVYCKPDLRDNYITPYHAERAALRAALEAALNGADRPEAPHDPNARVPDIPDSTITYAQRDALLKREEGDTQKMSYELNVTMRFDAANDEAAQAIEDAARLGLGSIPVSSLETKLTNDAGAVLHTSSERSE